MSQKIDSSNLDVIVIGAGPAGGSAARELAKRGKKVLLIEHSQGIGELNSSTAGTPKETIEMFELPKEVISASCNKITLATPRLKASWEYPEIIGYVLDFPRLKKFLAQDAVKYGAEIMVGTSVEDFVQENGKITGVRYHGVLGDGIARAKVIIDATGHYEFVNHKLGINPIPLEYLANGMEYQMAGLEKELWSSFNFYVGSEYAPSGYAWIFPMNKNSSAKVGVCTFRNKGSKKLEELQEQFMNTFPYFKNMEPIEIHAGTAICDGGVRNHVYKNIVLLGDAAHQASPSMGEGIRHALHASRMAAEVITDVLKTGELDEINLKKNYEKAWRKTFSLKWRLSFLVGNFLCQMNDYEFDELLQITQCVAPKDVFEAMVHYNYAAALKYPKLVAFLVKKGLKIARTIMKA